jgi:hypothetical protein
MNPIDSLLRPVKLLGGRSSDREGHRAFRTSPPPQKTEFHSTQGECLTWEYCPDLELIWCSKGLREFLGLEADVETISLMDIKERIHPEDVERAQSYSLKPSRKWR